MKFIKAMNKGKKMKMNVYATNKKKRPIMVDNTTTKKKGRIKQKSFDKQAH